MKITLAYHQTSDEKRATVTRVRTRTTTERTTGENSTQNDEEEEDEAKAAQGEGACAVGMTRMSARGSSCTAQHSKHSALHCTFEARRRLKGRSLTGSSLRNGVASGEGGMHDDADAGLGTVDAVRARDRQAQRRRSCSVGLGLLQVRR